MQQIIKLTFLPVYGLQTDPLILGVRERNENCEEVYKTIIKRKIQMQVNKVTMKVGKRL